MASTLHRAMRTEVRELVCNETPNDYKVQEVIAPLGPLSFSETGNNEIEEVPWFPKSIYDLDVCAKSVIMYGSGLDADHPGFKDEVYRKRRMMFAQVALDYKHGENIPHVEYTEEERKTWRTCYTSLKELHVKYACQEFLDNFEELESHCGYSEHVIPQLENVNKFLKARTGFFLRPAAGYIAPRDFLASLAFRVFFCTQYVRHHANPFYTPEPDVFHELIGHVPLFADPEFAQFSQEIGLASLGASDDDVNKLAALYFFSIEFGLSCESYADKLDSKQRCKVYGAGLLTSVDELRNAVEGSASIYRFDPDRVVQQECRITSLQSAYFYTRNFREAQSKLRHEDN